ncbi:two-component system response regulator BaeR [Aliidiomarina minuta]|uniref:Two-component system response regulator BaeR n=1 Tax=Aliidiomarina minuta TaxID=880057 RepID=A0A432W9J7_9GAMM|nr:response regulator [Aliidiomarina minuta]RUO26830.1 two-component system response regulator BaeR [Aliidiomarina minuta]
MSLVYVIEDEPDIQLLLQDYLIQAGLTVKLFADGAQGLQAIREEPPDLVILDIMLPGMDGLAVCQAVREFSQVPVIFLTARHDEIDRLLGLRLGADDYICKPFSPREVVARTEAILRRQQWFLDSASESLPQVSGLDLNEQNHSARLDGELLDLTPVEFRLLYVMATQPGRVFRRDQLVNAAYDDYRIVSDRTVDSHIKNLRAKLSASRPLQNFIQSVYGVGYRFEPESTLSP